MQPDKGRPLPGTGKAVACYKGRRAEARLQLPIASTRAALAEELAPVGWLTIGLLAADGLAVQVLPSFRRLMNHWSVHRGLSCKCWNAAAPVESGRATGGAGQGARRVAGVSCGRRSSDRAEGRGHCWGGQQAGAAGILKQAQDSLLQCADGRPPMLHQRCTGSKPPEWSCTAASQNVACVSGCIAPASKLNEMLPLPC